jgi:hypothetical protein
VVEQELLPLFLVFLLLTLEAVAAELLPDIQLLAAMVAVAEVALLPQRHLLLALLIQAVVVVVVEHNLQALVQQAAPVLSFLNTPSPSNLL